MAMEPCDLAQLGADAGDYDRHVRATEGIDRFCSSSAWVLAAAEGLMPGREPWIHRGEHGWVALMRGLHPEGWTYAEPLEAMWGLSCPLVGPRPAPLVADLAALARRRAGDWQVLLVSGVVPGSAMFVELLRTFSPRHRVGLGRTSRRHVASLAGGLDGYLGRRSRNFRRSLDKARRAAARAGVTFAPAHTEDPAVVLARILAVERRSWKGRLGVGIEEGVMRAFYEAMVPHLSARGALRAIFARCGERDVAYVLGGVLDGAYRGLQFSFDMDYAACSLGNLCQLEQIAELCEQGFGHYDLGTEMDYKRRWAEATHDTVAVLVFRSA
jgi:hypothetical protein